MNNTNNNAQNEETKQNKSEEKREKDFANMDNSKRDHPKHIDIIVDEHGRGAESVQIGLCGIKPIEAIGYLTIALDSLKKDVVGRQITLEGKHPFGSMLSEILSDFYKSKGN
ncbi:hypothetical protein [uncultured Chryseobacterium sp.]|uniref:hypothetical protein n=1 Tax=uncultured Chryseobacterium sp. TaxID=259322 RepID=UPI0025DCF8F0|nr:hypothetical protein [uncultured Chryseobacterium sp.]